jgi:hypothetical protein
VTVAGDSEITMSHFNANLSNPNADSGLKRAWTLFHHYFLGSRLGLRLVKLIVIGVAVVMAASLLGDIAGTVLTSAAVCLAGWVLIWRPLLRKGKSKYGAGARDLADAARNTPRVLADTALNRDPAHEEIQRRNFERHANRGR